MSEGNPGPLGEVERLLDAGRPDEAGDLLRAGGERVGRTRPGEVRLWLRQLDRLRGRSGAVDGYLDWSAGIALHLSGHVAESEERLRRAAASLRRSRRPALADRASLLLLDVLGERLQLERARRLGRRLVERFSRREDRERRAVALSNLACAEDAADRVARAAELWRRARRDLDPAGLRWLLVEANLGNAAMAAGRYAEAEAIHGAVRDAARERDLPALVSHASLNLAESLFARGQVDRALSEWDAVLTESVRTGNHAVHAAALVDLAAAEGELGDSARALSRAERAIAVAESTGLAVEAGKAARLAAVLDAAVGRRGRWRELSGSVAGAGASVARDLLLVEAALVDPTVEGERLVRAARRLIRNGLVHRGLVGLAWEAQRRARTADGTAARRIAREVLDHRRASPWARMLALHALATTEGSAGIRHLRGAARQADRLHGRLGAVADRAAFLAARGDVYLDLVAALLERGRPRDRREALDLLQRFRGGWLLDELSRRADHGGDPLVARWRELRRRLASLLMRVEGGDESRLRRSGLRVHDAVRDVEHELLDVERTLARRRPTFLPALASGTPGAVERLEQSLDRGEIAVELFLDRHDLLRFVVADGGVRAVRLPGAAGDIRALMASVRFHLEAAARGPASSGSTRALEARLERLGRLLLDGVPLDDRATLWIAPHGELFHVPWPAVPVASGAPLIDVVRPALVPGTGALAALLAERARPARSYAIGGASGPGLEMVAAEVEALAAVHPTAVRLEPVTRDGFLELLGRHDVVHLAGHAVFLDGLPSASGLRLEDGYLTVHDLAAAEISARLVSFGVCSGVRVATGTDGGRFEGFLRALLSGGVRTVVGAVAPVRDEIAHAFGVAFHRSLRGAGDPGRAYADGVREVRRLDPAPATWGAFHLWGDARAWEAE